MDSSANKLFVPRNVAPERRIAKAGDYEHIKLQLLLREFCPKREARLNHTPGFSDLPGRLESRPYNFSDDAIGPQFRNRLAVVTQPGKDGIGAIAFFRRRRP